MIAEADSAEGTGVLLGGRHSLSVVGRNGSGEKTGGTHAAGESGKRPSADDRTEERLAIGCSTVISGCSGSQVSPGRAAEDSPRALDPAVRDLVKAGCTPIDYRFERKRRRGAGLVTPNELSHASKIPVGYSLTRARLGNEFKKESLPRIGKIPSTRIAELAMAVRFGVLQKDRSITLCTEGLRKLPFHGRVVIIVNEHSHSAAEMVAAFASENHLGKTIGTRTAGEVLGGANFRVGSGYRVRIPVAAWYTWAGRTIEGTGVAPDLPVDVQFDDLSRQTDRQMETAVDFARRSWQ